MITYDWNCRTVDCYPEQNNEADVVYNVHWYVTGTSDVPQPAGGVYSSNMIGTQILDTSSITNFIPFDQLTNEEVVVWTKSAMGVTRVAGIETNIESQINALIAPTSVTLTIQDPGPVPPVEEEVNDEE